MLSKVSLCKDHCSISRFFKILPKLDVAANRQCYTGHERAAETPLALALQPKYVHMVTILDPEDLSPSQLVSFMSYMHEYGQVPKTYQLAFWQEGGVSICLDCFGVDCLFLYFWPTAPTIDTGFRLVIALFTGPRFLLPARLLGLCKFRYSPSPAWLVFLCPFY